MSRLHNLNAYLHFEAVARRASVTRAAEELSVSPSAVSQQIKSLEQQLGIKLFRREGRSFTLTLEGEQLYQAASTAIRLLKDAHRQLGKQHETMRLSFRVTPSLGVRWLGPKLAEFRALHADWDLRIDAAPDPTDFDREVMDFDIRYATRAWDGLYSVPVLSDRVLPLVSPQLRDELVAKVGTDSTALLNEAPLINSARALMQWDHWFRRNSINCTSNNKSVLLDRSSLAIQMAVDGAGVVLESLTLASREVAQGRLVALTPEIAVITFPAYWLVCPSRHMNRRSVRLFLSWMDTTAREHEEQVKKMISEAGMASEIIDAGAEMGWPVLQ